jgi:hypothetical protein
METIEMDNVNRPEGAEGDDEGAIAETPLDEDGFRAGLDDSDRLDDAKTSSFREENSNDKYAKRKRQLNELSIYGKFDDIKVEFVRRLFQTEYRIDTADGQNSKELVSRLDITKNKLTFNGNDVSYIDTRDAYNLSKDKKSAGSVKAFLKLYAEALKEHRSKAKSVVEEETGGETSRSGVEEIYEDAREEFSQEVTDTGDNLVERAMELEKRGKITTRERRELVGVTVPKGPPEIRIKALKQQKKVFETNIELTTDPERRQIMQEGSDVVERGIDNARLEMGLHPESEDGKHRFREKIRGDIRTGFEKFKRWAKENLAAIAAIAISIAGIITTVVVAGKKTIVGASKGLGAVGKALAGLAKSALPILVPILNLLSTILSWGAKGLAFLAQNLWIVAVLIAGAIYKYLQTKRKK